MTRTLPAAAVLAEDLRALAEVVPFDSATTATLEAAADYLDRPEASRSEQIAAGARALWNRSSDALTAVDPDAQWASYEAAGDLPYADQAERVLRAAGVAR